MPPANPTRLERSALGRWGGVGTSSTGSAAGESLGWSRTLCRAMGALPCGAGAQGKAGGKVLSLQSLRAAPGLL